VVNNMLRAGLRRSELAASEPAPYRLPTFSIGALALGLDFSKATALSAALEDEARIERLRRGL
jgi:hypothetical protein